MTTHSYLNNLQLKQQNQALMRALRGAATTLKEQFFTDSYSDPTYFIGPPSANSIRKGKAKASDWIVLIAKDPTSKAYVVKAVDDMLRDGKRS